MAISQLIDALEQRKLKFREQILQEIGASLESNLTAYYPALTESQRKERVQKELSSKEVEIELRKRSLIYVIDYLEGQVTTIGQVILLALWHLRREHFYEDSEQSWTSAVAQAISEINPKKYKDIQYIKALAQIASTILSYVNERELRKNPVIIVDDDGKEIGKLSVENDGDGYINLISTSGLLAKMKENANFFSSLPEEKRDEFLNVLVRSNKDGLSEYKDKKREEDGEMGTKIVVVVNDDGVSDKVTLTFEEEVVLKRKEYVELMKKARGIFKLVESA